MRLVRAINTYRCPQGPESLVSVVMGAPKQKLSYSLGWAFAQCPSEIKRCYLVCIKTVNLRCALTLLIRWEPGQFVHGSSWRWQSQASLGSCRTGQGTSLCGGHEQVARPGLQGLRGECRGDIHQVGTDLPHHCQRVTQCSPAGTPTALPSAGAVRFQGKHRASSKQSGEEQPRACTWLAEFPSGIPGAEAGMAARCSRRTAGLLTHFYRQLLPSGRRKILIKSTLSRTHVCWMNQYVQAIKEETSRSPASPAQQMERGPGTPLTAWHLPASLREGTRLLGQS